MKKEKRSFQASPFFAAYWLSSYNCTMSILTPFQNKKWREKSEANRLNWISWFFAVPYSLICSNFLHSLFYQVDQKIPDKFIFWVGGFLKIAQYYPEKWLGQSNNHAFQSFEISGKNTALLSIMLCRARPRKLFKITSSEIGGIKHLKNF